MRCRETAKATSNDGDFVLFVYFGHEFGEPMVGLLSEVLSQTAQRHCTLTTEQGTQRSKCMRVIHKGLNNVYTLGMSDGQYMESYLYLLKGESGERVSIHSRRNMQRTPQSC